MNEEKPTHKEAISDHLSVTFLELVPLLITLFIIGVAPHFNESAVKNEILVAGQLETKNSVYDA